MDQDKGELNWQSYDKSTRYNHERTVYPPPPPSQYAPYYRYEEYGENRLLPPPHQAEISPRSYPESDYYQRAQVQRSHFDGRSADAASVYRTEQRFYDEERERAERAERERAERTVREQREAEARSHRETHHTGAAKNGKNGHTQSYSHHASAYTQRGGGGGGYRASSSGRRVGKDRQYRIYTCCCFRFYWPPWGYETVDPIQPWYPARPSRPGSPSLPPIGKEPR